MATTVPSLSLQHHFWIVFLLVVICSAGPPASIFARSSSTWWIFSACSWIASSTLSTLIYDLSISFFAAPNSSSKTSTLVTTLLTSLPIVVLGSAVAACSRFISSPRLMRASAVKLAVVAWSFLTTSPRVFEFWTPSASDYIMFFNPSNWAPLELTLIVLLPLLRLPLPLQSDDPSISRYNPSLAPRQCSALLVQK